MLGPRATRKNGAERLSWGPLPTTCFDVPAVVLVLLLDQWRKGEGGGQGSREENPGHHCSRQAKFWGTEMGDENLSGHLPGMGLESLQLTGLKCKPLRAKTGKRSLLSSGCCF